MNTENLKIVILPEGVANVGDIFESEEFKTFVQTELAKPKEPPKTTLLPNGGFVVSGTGRSYLMEYVNTLPEITEEELYSGKAEGRHVMAFQKD